MEEEDLRIRLVRKILGVPEETWCRFCKWLIPVMGHKDTCTLRVIDPKNMYKELADVKIRLRKEANKQRIFKSDKKRWSGMPPMQKTTVKKRRSKNRGPARELKRCRVCLKETLFEARNGVMTCSTCEHDKPCRWMWPGKGRNCQTCWPGE